MKRRIFLFHTLTLVAALVILLAVSGGVVLNSLDPADPLYREDLVQCLNAVGSIF